MTIRAGPTTLALNATTGAIASIQRSTGREPSLLEFLPFDPALQVPLFTLALTRLTDLGGPLQVQSSDFRSVSVQE